jgi:hypothetical protein
MIYTASGALAPGTVQMPIIVAIMASIATPREHLRGSQGLPGVTLAPEEISRLLGYLIVV